jgi:guanylate cyclase soluble subunit beta
LYSVLPPSIANQLRHGNPISPARYEQVSLIFCGIKDFGNFCAKHSKDSQKIVNLLNLVFTKFDEKVNTYPEIYKVETVGDKYMAVCGLPDKIDEPTKFICRLALDIMDSTKELNKHVQKSSSSLDEYDKDEEIVITCGINTGDIVTGVIGKRMPRYCLFGDTVNLTSRCETSGIKGKINVSNYSYQKVCSNNENEFHFEYRGEIQMKGKPLPIKMWILTRKQQKFNSNNSGQGEFETNKLENLNLNLNDNNNKSIAEKNLTRRKEFMKGKCPFSM